MAPPLSATHALPPDFLWGVATAGYQVEGGGGSQWRRWEQQGRTRHRCGEAAGFRRHYLEDIERAARLGVRAFRLSVEWSRLEPARGVIDREEVAYYDSVIAAIVARNMTPIVTLLHFTYPQWVDDEGGWSADWTVPAYLAHAARVVRRYHDKVRHWITFNEPNVWVPLGWLCGIHAPGRRDPRVAVKVARNVIRAHRLAYDLIHQLDPDAAVSTNLFHVSLRPRRVHLSLESFDRDWVLARVEDKLDYLAVDYYYRFERLLDVTLTSEPWRCPIDPEGLYVALKGYAARYPRLPILVAENGMATYNLLPRADGWTREQHLVAHVAAMQRAAAEGVNVFGYCYWSLMDNYEWGEFDSRFGLFSVDARWDPTLERIPTEAADTYRRIIADNGVG